VVNSVAELLDKNNISYRISGKDLVIKCLNPDHEDTNPSCRVDKNTGLTHCFSCGFKANIFRHFGLTAVPSTVAIQKLKDKLKQLTLSEEVPFPYNKIPFVRKFRGISPETFKHFMAFYTDEPTLENRVIFPIVDILGRNKAYIARHMLSEAEPRYIIYPSNASFGVYPEFFQEKYSSVVLVEGIFDLLNLYDKGLENVSCTFGTSTLMKSFEGKLLPFKSQGIEKIYILYDSDKPGIEAANKLYPKLEHAGFSVEVLSLPEEDTDPGNLTQEEVNGILEYISEDSNNRQST
jgi:DNA primase